MQTIRETAALRKAVAALRGGGTIALVPTMGALHAGHMALVARARELADHVVVSIFVNPAQFGPGEDLDRYPRREEADAAMLDGAGCALLWAPDAAHMYPAGFATTIHVAELGDGLCGARRPGHFDSVATVVAKLLNQVRPDVAIFGEKDYQQLAVIRRMAADLDLATEIIGAPIQRDADGLALSSRNAYLSAEERIAARTLPRVLGDAVLRLREGGDVEAMLDVARDRLADAGFGPIDYVALVDDVTLNPLITLDRPGRLLAAAWMGRTRLIDNLHVS